MVLVLSACQTSQKSEEKSKVVLLKDEVMAIHDDVMPKMGELRKVKKYLLQHADSIAEADSSRAAVLTVLARRIEDANEGMRDWMRNYEPEFTGSEEEILAYLEEQKKAIEKVKYKMEGSLARGNAVLGRNAD